MSSKDVEQEVLEKISERYGLMRLAKLIIPEYDQLDADTVCQLMRELLQSAPLSPKVVEILSLKYGFNLRGEISCAQVARELKVKRSLIDYHVKDALFVLKKRYAYLRMLAKPREEWLTGGLENFDLSQRTLNALQFNGINTLSALVARSAIDLVRCPRIGRKILNEIREKLGELDLSLAQK